MCKTMHISCFSYFRVQVILFDLTPATNSWSSGKHKVMFFIISHSMCGLIQFKRIFSVSAYFIASISSASVAHSSMPVI